MTNNTQSQISFIKQVCGGDSLQHVLKKLRSIVEGEIYTEGRGIFTDIITPKSIITWLDLCGCFFKKIKDAKLENQSEDTINELSFLLGFNPEVTHE